MNKSIAFILTADDSIGMESSICCNKFDLNILHPQLNLLEASRATIYCTLSAVNSDIPCFESFTL